MSFIDPTAASPSGGVWNPQLPGVIPGPFIATKEPNIFDAIEKVIDKRIDNRLMGRTDGKFNGTKDHELVLELIARGFAVFKPMVNEGEGT